MSMFLQCTFVLFVGPETLFDLRSPLHVLEERINQDVERHGDGINKKRETKRINDRFLYRYLSE